MWQCGRAELPTRVNRNNNNYYHCESCCVPVLFAAARRRSARRTPSPSVGVPRAAEFTWWLFAVFAFVLVWISNFVLCGTVGLVASANPALPSAVCVPVWPLSSRPHVHRATSPSLGGVSPYFHRNYLPVITIITIFKRVLAKQRTVRHYCRPKPSQTVAVSPKHHVWCRSANE